jgi:cytochrome c biogenesis protein CcmG/thiol:disulfide interchange protein DsbE
MKNLVVLIGWIILVSLALTSFPVCAQTQIGEKAPGFITSTLDGKRITLRGYWEKQGKRVIVLSFFATWCQPCKEDLKYLQTVQDRHGSQGLQILGVHTRDSAKESEVRVFLQKLGVNLPVLMDQDGIIGKRYGLIGLPCNFMIDKEGILKGKYLGYSEDVKREFETLIRVLLSPSL